MADVGKLVDLVERLRAPDGCPWDREQGLADLRAYLLEESHEAAAALDRVVEATGSAPAPNAWSDAPDTRAKAPGDGPTDAVTEAWDALGGELGDLLFQVAFVLRLGAEEGRLDASAVVDRVHRKMVERHPHVFPPPDGDGAVPAERPEDADAVRRAWERNKLARGESPSLLGGVPQSLPALLAAYRLTQKAAGVGFDWPDAEAVLAKLDEEVAELRAEIGGDPARVRDEVGDLLFTAVNLARKLGVDPEGALAATNAKFRRRFAHVEAGLAERGRRLEEAKLEEMDALWEAAKRREA